MCPNREKAKAAFGFALKGSYFEAIRESVLRGPANLKTACEVAVATQGVR
jgi:hypothetical protein